MIGVFYIRRGSLLPYYRVEVRDKDGVVDLSAAGVTDAYFRMSNLSTGSLITSALAYLTSPATGQAEHRWAVADTASAGEFEASFVFVTPSGNFTLPCAETTKIVVE